MNHKLIPTILIVAFAVISGAADTSLLASKNLTVQPAGPRTGSNGLRFLNAEGADLGSFASFGAIEFDPTLLPSGPNYAAFTGMKFQIGQSNAAFTQVSGKLDIFITQDNLQAFDQTNTNIFFDGANVPSGITANLFSIGAPLIDIGDLDFVFTNATGFVYDVSLTLGATGKAYMQSRLTNNTPIRMLLASSPSSTSPNGVTATLAGYTNTSVPGPTLVISTGSSATAGGTITLQAWVGNTAAQKATFELVSGTSAVETIANVALDANGNYSFTPTVAGTYDLYANVSHWLKKKVGSYTFGGNLSGVNATLANGDVDGDNVVSVFDYIILSDAFDAMRGDAGFVDGADLDGDDVVSVFDYIILSDQFDVSGDTF